MRIGKAEAALVMRNLAALAPCVAQFVRAPMPAQFTAGRLGLAGFLRRGLPPWQSLAEELGHSDLVQESGHGVLWVSEFGARRPRDAWMAAGNGENAPIRGLGAAELDGSYALLKQCSASGLSFIGTEQGGLTPRSPLIAERGLPTLPDYLPAVGRGAVAPISQHAFG